MVIVAMLYKLDTLSNGIYTLQVTRSFLNENKHM